jgi:hypothetical protein
MSSPHGLFADTLSNLQHSAIARPAALTTVASQPVTLDNRTDLQEVNVLRVPMMAVEDEAIVAATATSTDILAALEGEQAKFSQLRGFF